MAQNPNYDANVVKQILAVTNNGNKQMLTQMFNDPTKRYLQPAIILAGMQSDADQRQIALQQGAQPTVAAQTLGIAPPPPAPPAGLGATPQGMQMAGGPAPQGAPPMQMASAPAPQGMPQMAGGGLTTLPIPDSMLDEQTFAGGGIVAFKDGAKGKKREKTLDDAIARLNLIPEADPYAASAPINMTPYNEHGPLYPAKEFLRDNIGLSPETRSLRDEPNNSAVDGNQMPSFALPQNADDSIYSPRERISNPELVRSLNQDKPGYPAPKWYGVGGKSPLTTKQQLDMLRNAKFAPIAGLDDVDPDAQMSLPHALIAAAGQNVGNSAKNLGLGAMKGAVGGAGGIYDLFTEARGGPKKAHGPYSWQSADALPSGEGKYFAKATPYKFGDAAPASSPSLADLSLKTPRPRVPGTLTTKPKADADTTAPAAKTPTIEDLQKKFDETGKLPDFKKLSAEERAAQKNEDLWSTVLDFSARLLSGKNQNALTNAGEAAAGAMPGMQAALKERRADEKDERKREFDYLVKAQGVKGDNLKSAYTVFNSMEDRAQRETLEAMRINAQASEGKLNRQNQLAVAYAPTGGENTNALNVAAFKQHYLAAGKTPAEAEYLARKDVLAAGASQFAGATALSGILKTQRENAVKTRRDILRNEGKRYPDKASQKAALDAIEERIASIDADTEQLGTTYGGSPSGAVTVPWRSK